MDSFELNKILGAVFAALLLWVGAGNISNILYHHPAPEKPGYIVTVAAKEEEKTEEKAVPFPELLAAADPVAGEKELKKKCSGCHTYDKDGKHKQGPNLWGVYDRELAAVGDYKYSSAMKGKGGKWTSDELNLFLENPKKHLSGTKMAFKGIRNDKKRAALIKYLGTLK